MIFSEALPTWALFLELFVVGLIVILAGAKFAKLADKLADYLNIGGGWIGLILLATVTSLPELVSGATATTIGNVDLALGGIFGSCAFNIVIIVLMNAIIGGGSVLRKVSPSHTLTSSFGLALIGIALFGLVVSSRINSSGPIAQWFEITWALLILVAYLGCVRLVYRFEKSQNTIASAPAENSVQRVPTSMYIALTVLACIIVLASWWLACLGDVLSTHKIGIIGRPLGATFVGACFLALATSLPEIATSVAAIRLGNIDLALGNIFGSNMFNIFVIPVLKVVSMIDGQPVLLAQGSVSQNDHMITGLTAILLTVITVGSLVYKSRRTVLRRFGFDAVLISITYVGGMLLLLL